VFGFIKTVQGFLSKLKKNKRWWFTSLFIIASLGVTFSVVILIITTDSVSKEVYASQTKEFLLKYKDLEKLKEKKLQNLAIIASYDDAIIDKLEKNDATGISQFESKLNTKIAQQDKNLMIFKFYSLQNKSETFRSSIISSIQTKNSIFGIEVLFDGIFYVYLHPILKNDNVVGILEIKESIYSVKESFDRTSKQFAFLLDTKMIAMISQQNKDGIYQEVGKNYLINSKIYENKLSSSIISLDENALQNIAKGEYIVGKEFFINGLLLRDTNGVDIGILILGEGVEKEGGFINMANKMTNHVIAIALGLIVSLLLFMF
jgi:hypothetical protein